jgi:hypothetical protein
MIRKNEERMVSKKTLKIYGFTNKMINRFLPIPDKEIENNHSKNSPTIKLYFLSKVKRVMEREDFKIMSEEVKEKRSDRKISAAKSVETKKRKILEYAESLDIEIEEILSKEKLIKCAIFSYNDFQSNKGSRSFALESSNTSFLNMITVNYIRYNMSDYEENIYKSYGKVGRNLAANIIRKKVFLAIIRAYPWLEEECNKQMSKIGIKY